MNLKKLLKLPRIFLSEIKEIYFESKIGKLADGDYFLKYNIPSFTQWESKELVEDIIVGKIDCKDDPLWKNSGAKNRQEYEMYSWQICGMTCLKMILKSIYPEKEYKLVELAKEAEKEGVYRKNNKTNIRENLDGMMHMEFLKFIRRFKLKGFRLNHIKENMLANFILNNYFIIASVHPSIREDKYIPNSKSGHLILIKGFKLKNGKISGFYINNPSGYLRNKSQENYLVSVEKWNGCFSGNADIISN